MPTSLFTRLCPVLGTEAYGNAHPEQTYCVALGASIPFKSADRRFEIHFQGRKKRESVTLAGREIAHARGFAIAAALALESRAWGMSVHWPSPWKRQPWYEHMRVPSDGSIRPSA